MLGSTAIRTRLFSILTTAALCVGVLGAQLTAAQSEELLVDGARPLAAAVKEISKRCRCVITYEDVRWTRNQVELSPVMPSSGGQPAAVPRNHPFTLTIPKNVAEMSSDEVGRSIRGAISEFAASQNPGDFKLVQGQALFHVLPNEGAVLETPISVSINGTQALVALETAIEELQRLSGRRITMWRVPLNALKRPVHVRAVREPAYDVMSRVLRAVDDRLSWELQYDTNTSSYHLTIYFSYQ